MLQNSLLGAVLKRGRADPIHDPGLVLIDLDTLDQRPDDLSACRPVRAFQTRGHPTRELLEPTDHQPQFRLHALLIGPPLMFLLLLQPREPLPRRRDARLELRPLQQTFPIRIDQSGDRRNAFLSKHLRFQPGGRSEISEDIYNFTLDRESSRSQIY
jgi:hypothetical protein